MTEALRSAELETERLTTELLTRRLRERRQRLEPSTAQQQQQNLIADATAAGGEVAAQAVASNIGAPIPAPDPTAPPIKQNSFFDIRRVNNPNTGTKTLFVNFSPEGQRFLIEAAPQLVASVTPVGIPLRVAMSALAGGVGSLAAQNVDPVEDPQRRAFFSAVLAAGGEFLPSVVGKTLVSSSGTLKKGAAEAASLLTEQGIKPAPAGFTESFGTDLFQTIGESSILKGGSFRRFKQQAADDAQRGFLRFIDRSFGENASRGSVGDIIQQGIEDSLVLKKEAVRQAYLMVDDVAPLTVDAAGSTIGGGVDMMQTRGLMARLLSPEQGGRSPLAAEMRRILKRPERITFEEASNLRSQFGSAQDPGTAVFRGRAKADATQIFKALDEAIETAGKDLEPEALAMWREATALAKEQHAVFGTKTVRAFLSKESPDKVFKSLAGADAATVRSIREILLKLPDGGQKWRAVQGEFLNDFIISPGVLDTNNIVNGKKLVERLGLISDDRFVRDEIKAFFPDETIRKRMQTWARAIELSQASPDAGAFGMAAKFSQLGAVGMLALEGRGLRGKALKVLLPPAAFAVMLQRPAMFKLLVTGFKSKPGSRQAITAGTKLLTLLQRNGLILGLEDPDERATLQTILSGRTPTI